MVKHNNMVPNGHFHKQWQNRVRVMLDQPGRALRRRLNRKKKAAKIAPRPSAGPIRPIVRCPSNRYNTKIRIGRGFTIEELRGAKISLSLAPTIGIAVDKRRTNKSKESLELNIQRLKDYKARLVVFPFHSRKAKQGDSTKEELENVKQVNDKNVIPLIDNSKKLASSGFMEITEEMKKKSAVGELRKARRSFRAVARKRWAKKAADPNAAVPVATGGDADDE